MTEPLSYVALTWLAPAPARIDISAIVRIRTMSLNRDQFLVNMNFAARGFQSHREQFHTLHKRREIWDHVLVNTETV
jgi:hypothetical protein